MARNGAMENAFRSPSAIATLSAGRNMCLAMEFWGKSTQIIAQNSDIPLIPSPTELGDRIFGELVSTFYGKRSNISVDSLHAG